MEAGKQYKHRASGVVYKCLHVAKCGIIFMYSHGEHEYDFFEYMNDAEGRYEEYVPPIIEYRYARAVCINYNPLEGDGYRTENNYTWWTKKRSSSDNLRAMFIDGKLTGVEIIK